MADRADSFVSRKPAGASFSVGLVGLAGLLTLIFAGLAVPVRAETAPQVVFIGADPEEGAPGPVTAAVEIVRFETLPEAESAADEVASAMLRARAVSTFVIGDDLAGASRGDLHLVVDMEILPGDGAGDFVGRIGVDEIPLASVAARLEVLAEALRPEARQMAYLRLRDDDQAFPRAFPALRDLAQALEFEVVVITFDGAATCDAGRVPHHFAVLSGMADRAPYGDSDGTTTRGEVRAYLERTFARDAARDTPCATSNSLIFTRGSGADAATSPSRPVSVVRQGSAPVMPTLTEAVRLEEFAALFLSSSENAETIADYLATCRYCPSEAALQAQLNALQSAARAQALEAEIWVDIQSDETPERIEVYLANCQICAHRAAAEARLEVLSVDAQVRAAETAELASLLAEEDIEGLRRWLANCEACEGQVGAEERVATLEAARRHAAEVEALRSALVLRDAEALRAWLATCERCGGREEAAELLAALDEEAAAAQPCVAVAGMPQQGGPRLLAEESLAEAAETCDAVLSRDPDNAIATTLRARVALAAEDYAAADAGFQAGMDAGLAQAFGLAAHRAYDPMDETDPDYARAEELALRGYEAGDWFSGEVLVVLYSRELVPGRTASEAFDIALAQAGLGNPAAQFFVGFFYSTGTGTAPDMGQAVRWYDAAVEQDYAHAAAFLADILEVGVEAEGDAVAIPAEPERAGNILLDAVALGDPAALERLTTRLRDRPREVVRAVQARLDSEGLLNGSVDGVGGRGTVRSVTAFYDLHNPEAE